MRNWFWQVRVRSKADSKRLPDVSASRRPVRFPGFLRSAANSRRPTAPPISFCIPARRRGRRPGRRSQFDARSHGQRSSGRRNAAWRNPGSGALRRDGLLVPERDSAALAAALFEIADNSGTYQTFSRNAAESVREKFEQARSIASLEGFYRELIN